MKICIFNIIVNIIIMLRYMSVVLLYAITYCMASDIKTDTPVSGLTDSAQKLLPNTNENLALAQRIIYIYEPRQWKMQGISNLIEKAGSGYLITPGMGAHKLHARKLSWNKARKACVEEGGHLAIINSISEEKLLLHLLEENEINEAWLGIHDLYEENDWNTIMDEPLEATGFSKWRSNEPNNQNQIQHCGLLEKIGMDDRECTGQYSFFCEIAL